VVAAAALGTRAVVSAFSHRRTSPPETFRTVDTIETTLVRPPRSSDEGDLMRLDNEAAVRLVDDVGTAAAADHAAVPVARLQRL
jgi:hypothetical protein